MRILLDPSPEAAGGGPALAPPSNIATPPAAAPAPAPAPSPPAPASTPTMIHVSSDEYKALLDVRTRLATIEASNKIALDEKESQRIKEMTEKGQIKEALAAMEKSKSDEVAIHRERANKLETQILDDRKEVVVSKALDGVVWVSQGAGKIIREHLESRMISERDASGAVVVLEKGTRRPAADVINEFIKSPDASYAIKAKSSGGTGSQGGQHAPPANPGEPAPEFAFSEALITRELEIRALPSQNPYALGGRISSRS